MPFSFTFSGGFFDLSSFFAKLEHFVTVNNKHVDVTGRLLRLESSSIAPASAGFPDMQAEIGAATYLVPPSQGVTGAPRPPGAARPRPRRRRPDAATPPTTTATPGAAR